MAHIAVALGSEALLRRPSASVESSVMLERIRHMQRGRVEMREEKGEEVESRR